jgi:hypothetical protein
MGHEDDVDNEQDVNMRGYPFEEYGFECRSLQSSLFDLLLSYKIERPVFRGFETDWEFSINAVNPSPVPLSQLNVKVEASKFEYLLAEKAFSLKRIGLMASTHRELEDIIQEKLSSNYIYNMCYDDEDETTKFDILLEVRTCDASAPFRTLVALKYVPKERCLRLITLY